MTRLYTTLFFAGLTAVIGLIAILKPSDAAAKKQLAARPESTTNPNIVNRPGVRWPSVKSAAMAELSDEAVVLGVVVGNKSRAYWSGAMSAISRHVVNDVIDGVPITITFCDLAHCARAYTGGTTGEPLPIDVGGFNERMMLKIGSGYYWQDTAEPVDGGAAKFPYQPYTIQEMTWKEWKAAHPDTDVYVGDDP